MGGTSVGQDAMAVYDVAAAALGNPDDGFFWWVCAHFLFGRGFSGTVCQMYGMYDIYMPLSRYVHTTVRYAFAYDTYVPRSR